MKRSIPEKNTLLCAAEDHSVIKKLETYITACRPPPEADPKKEVGRIPNLAGFCAYLKCGCDAFDELQQKFPYLADYLCAVFEDEALNAIRSPTLWSTYVKERLGGVGNPAEEDGVQLVFEHDIEEDGA